jgi:hypothetical protein
MLAPCSLRFNAVSSPYHPLYLTDHNLILHLTLLKKIRLPPIFNQRLIPSGLGTQSCLKFSM